MAKYLITGGAGFIGSHLAQALIADKHQVISIDNFDAFYNRDIKTSNLEEIGKGLTDSSGTFESVEGDLRDAECVKSIFSRHQFDGVFHLAGKAGVRPSLEDPVAYWDVNCTGTAVLLNQMQKSGVKKLVFASSSSVYGNCSESKFSEDLFVGEPVSPYAATKRAGELLCYNFHHLYDMNTICIRFFTVYGPRQRPDLAIHKFTKLIFEGKAIPFFGDGTTERDYTYVTDIVQGVVKAMEYAKKCGYDIINLGESNTISLNGLVGLLESAIGKKAALKKLPMQPGDVFRTSADVSKAKDRLGYKPTVTKSEGIEKFVAWYREKHDL